MNIHSIDVLCPIARLGNIGANSSYPFSEPVDELTHGAS